MMNLLNRTAVALLKVIEVETQEATKEQADAWLRRVLLLEKFYRYTNILFRILIPVAIVAAIYLLWRIARNLEKPPKVTEEVKIVRKSLSEMLKENRTRCKMTQEFVAETIGVSRQAVSKWENGTSEPNTSNLMALARLYGIPAEDLLKGVESALEAQEK